MININWKKFFIHYNNPRLYIVKGLRKSEVNWY